LHYPPTENANLRGFWPRDTAQDYQGVETFNIILTKYEKK